MRRIQAVFVLALTIVSGLVLLRTEAGAAKSKNQLLYMTLSAGFHHESVPLSTQIVKEIGDRSGMWETTVVDSVEPFTAENLKNYDAVMFYTTGELPFTEVQKQAFSDWLKAGHGFIGVHSATDTFYTWKDYHKIIGGYFTCHPWHQEVTVEVADPDDKIVQFLGSSFKINDEIYQIGDFLDDDHVLLALDPMSVDRTKPCTHLRYYGWPLAWTRKYGKGRVFYTALGHEDAVWKSEQFQQLLQNGIGWTMHEFGAR